MHRDAITAAGAELVRFARGCGLIRGEWIAIDGSKFRAVASVDSTRERLALQRYLEGIEKADQEQQTNFDPSAIQAALEKLRQHPEPDAGYMLVRQTALPAYNVQTAVDTEHALIVAHAVVLDASDIRCLKPMAEAARKALGMDSFNVVADAGYSNGEQVAYCEAAGMVPFVPVMRTVNNQGDGTLFGRADFRYEPDSDTYVCPGDPGVERSLQALLVLSHLRAVEVCLLVEYLLQQHEQCCVRAATGRMVTLVGAPAIVTAATTTATATTTTATSGSTPQAIR